MSISISFSIGYYTKVKAPVCPSIFLKWEGEILDSNFAEGN